MATYEFKCCGMTQEIVIDINEILHKPKCQICNGDMQRVYAAPAIVFKGSGFYANEKR